MSRSGTCDGAQVVKGSLSAFYIQNPCVSTSAACGHGYLGILFQYDITCDGLQ